MSEVSGVSESVQKSVKTIDRMTESIKDSFALFIGIVLLALLAGTLVFSLRHMILIKSGDISHLCWALIMPLLLISVLMIIRLVLYTRFDLK